MKKIGLAAAVLLAMTGAHAYQFEVQGQSEYVNTTENDKNFTGDLQGTYYFKDVDASKGPLAEAAFLNKASNVSVAYTYEQYNVKHAEDYQIGTYGVKGEAYFTTPYTSSIPLYASASYNHTDLDSKNSNDKDDNGERYALEVGAMPTDNFLLAVGYTNVANQFSLDTFRVLNKGFVNAVGETASINDKQDAVTARTKYVGAIDGTNMSIGFDAGLVFGDATSYEFNTDLYLTPKLSVGASFAGTSESEAVFDKLWGANVNYFITPSISVGASYVKANAVDGHNLDTDTVGLNAKARF